MHVLRLCPFCGESPVIRKEEREDSSRAPRPHWWFVIECEHCEVRMERESDRWWSGMTGLPLTAEDTAAELKVVESWNRRH